MAVVTGQQRVLINPLTLAVWAAYTMIGLTITIFGPTMSFLSEHFQISIGQAGLFVGFMAMGRMVSVMGSGRLTDIVGRKPILLLGTSLLACGLLGVASAPWYRMGLAMASVAGVGHGMVDTSAAATIADNHPHSVALAMNFGHMFFGIGCLVGPLVAGALLSMDVNWQNVYYLKAGIGVTIVLCLKRLQFPPLQAGPSDTTKVSSMLSLVTVLLAAIMFLYSGVGHSINAWMSSYMVAVGQASLFLAASSVTIYNLGLVLGRLVCGLISARVSYCPLILTMSLMSLAAMVTAVVAVDPILTVMAIGATGFSFGGLFPTVLEVAGRLYPAGRGTITGVLIAVAAAGSMVLPAAVGYMSQLWSFAVGFRILPAFLVLLTAVGVLLWHRTPLCGLNEENGKSISETYKEVSDLS